MSEKFNNSLIFTLLCTQVTENDFVNIHAAYISTTVFVLFGLTQDRLDSGTVTPVRSF